AFGTAFGQLVVRSSSPELYAAVGMASFIAAGYKTPLAAVVFVAEATGGHAFIIPALIGSAVAYAISGDASVSGDQRLHEGVRVRELKGIKVREIMQQQVVSVQARLSLREFAHAISPRYRHTSFPVMEGRTVLGIVPSWSLTRIEAEKWTMTTVSDITDRGIIRISPDCDVMEALRLLLSERTRPMLLVMSASKTLEGIVTKTDILEALKTRGDEEVLDSADETV
ncbi:MAG: CBS domain-containing protein, partial [Candidatus Sulfotelmatobacter sp.]